MLKLTLIRTIVAAFNTMFIKLNDALVAKSIKGTLELGKVLGFLLI